LRGEPRKWKAAEAASIISWRLTQNGWANGPAGSEVNRAIDADVPEAGARSLSLW